MRSVRYWRNQHGLFFSGAARAHGTTKLACACAVAPRVADAMLSEQQVHDRLVRDLSLSSEAQAQAVNAADATLDRLRRIAPPSQRNATLQTPLGTAASASVPTLNRWAPPHERRTPLRRKRPPLREHPLVPWGAATISSEGSLARSMTEPRLAPRPPPRLHPSEERQGDDGRDTFGVSAAGLLASELTRTSRVLSHAESSWVSARHQSMADLAQREKEIRMRVEEARAQAKAEERERSAAAIARERQQAAKAVASAGSAAAKQSEVMQMAAQVSRQRQKLEKELGKEARRAAERAAAEDAWAAHVRELESQLRAQETRAIRAESAIGKLERDRDERFEYLARLAVDRVAHASVRAAWRAWADPARRERTEIRHAAAVGAGVRRVFERISQETSFHRWVAQCRLVNLQDALHSQQLTERANGELCEAERVARSEVRALTAQLEEEQAEACVQVEALSEALEAMKEDLRESRREAKEKMLTFLHRQAQRRKRLERLNSGLGVWMQLQERRREVAAQMKSWEPAIATFRMHRSPPARLFGRWRSRWRLRVLANSRVRLPGSDDLGDAESAKARAALEEKLKSEARLRLQSEAEAERLRRGIERGEQALALEQHAHEETKRMLHTARFDLAAAQRVERRAVNTAAKRGAAEEREVAALDEAKRAKDALAQGRDDARRAAAEQKRLAEEQLSRLLAAQRRELEARMDQMGREHALQLAALRERQRDGSPRGRNSDRSREIGSRLRELGSRGSEPSRISRGRSTDRSLGHIRFDCEPSPPRTGVEAPMKRREEGTARRTESGGGSSGGGGGRSDGGGGVPGSLGLMRRGFGYFSQRRALHRSASRLGYSGDDAREAAALGLAHEAVRSPWLAPRPDFDTSEALAAANPLAPRPELTPAEALLDRQRRAAYGEELLRLTTRRHESQAKADAKIIEIAGGPPASEGRRPSSAVGVWKRVEVFEAASAATSVVASSSAATTASRNGPAASSSASHAASSSDSAVPRSAPPPPPPPPPPASPPPPPPPPPPPLPPTQQTAAAPQSPQTPQTPQTPTAAGGEEGAFLRRQRMEAAWERVAMARKQEEEQQQTDPHLALGYGDFMAMAEAPEALEAAWERVAKARDQHVQEHERQPAASDGVASRYLGSGVW